MYAEIDCYELHPAEGEAKTKYALVNIPLYYLRHKRAISHKFMTISNNMNFGDNRFFFHITPMLDVFSMC